MGIEGAVRYACGIVVAGGPGEKGHVLFVAIGVCKDDVAIAAVFAGFEPGYANGRWQPTKNDEVEWGEDLLSPMDDRSAKDPVAGFIEVPADGGISFCGIASNGK